MFRQERIRDGQRQALPQSLGRSGTTSSPVAQTWGARVFGDQVDEIVLGSEQGIDLHGYISGPSGEGKLPAIILLVPGSIRDEIHWPVGTKTNSTGSWPP